MLTAADLCKANGALYIETVKGNRFYFNRPVFDYEEIAHSLSMQCRYTGHARRFYSVAEHSLLVSAIMLEFGLGDPREGLLHDAVEAYLSDIAAPWKAMLPDYKRIEHELDGHFRRWAKLPATITDGCKRADWIALMFEANQLIPSRGKEWECPEGIRDQAALLLRRHFKLRCLSPSDVLAEFTGALHDVGLVHVRP